MGVRAHIVLAEELLRSVDRIAGRRGRSRFVEEAVREKLARDVLSVALQDSAGVLDSEHYPEWATPETVSVWVRAIRRLDDRRAERKLRERT